MEAGREFRELLAADAALMLGVAEAHDVAAALMRYWPRRDEPGASFGSELAHIARLSDDALARIRAEVERLVGEAGGTRRSPSPATAAWTARSTWRWATAGRT